MRTLNEMPDGSHIILDAKRNQYMHPDVKDIIEEFAEKAPNHDIKFEVINT